LLTLSVVRAVCFAHYLRRMKTWSFPMCPIRSHTRPHAYEWPWFDCGGPRSHDHPGHTFYPARSSDSALQCSGTTQFRSW
jgi:hypothetical protein